MHEQNESVHPTWGASLRAWRESLSLSQQLFTGQMAALCNASNIEYARFTLRLTCQREAPLAAFEVSRFENGVRTPTHRATHLTLLWALLQLGCALTPERANQWLELGRQGWLTAREREVLFPERFPGTEPP
jgi:hypothetical protein